MKGKKRAIWLSFSYDCPKREVYTALKQLLLKYPKMGLEIYMRDSGSSYYVRFEVPKELSEKDILEGVDINYSVTCTSGEMFKYLRNTPRNIEYDAEFTMEILNSVEGNKYAETSNQKEMV